MSKKANQEAHNKRIRKFLPLLILSFFFTTISALSSTGSVYADTCGSYGADAIIIYSDNITYPANIDQSTAEYNESTSTLTLDNYNGGPICVGGSLTLVLRNTNTLTSNNSAAVQVNGSLFIEGNGELDIVTENGSLEHAFEATNAVVDGGAINVTATEQSPLASQCAVFMLEDMFIMNDGEILSDCGLILDGEAASTIIINDGTISVSQASSQIFNQNGGTLNIAPKSSTVLFPILGDEIDTCFFSPAVIVNGGNLNIDCSNQQNAIAMVLANSLESIEDHLKNRQVPYSINGNTLTMSMADFMRISDKDDAAILIDKSDVADLYLPVNTIMAINDSDVDVKSNLNSVLVLFFCDETETTCNESSMKNITLDRFIKIGDGLITEPPLITPYYYFMTQDNGDEPHMFVLTDGTDGVYVNFKDDGIEVSDNVLKTLHIYKATIPTPNTDGSASTDTEEVPNTLDYRLLSIIATVLVSIVAEAFIILDLRHRVSAFKKQIAEEENIDDK